LNCCDFFCFDGVLDRMLIEDEGEPTNGPAIVLHTALAFGFHEDERVQAGVARIEEVLRQDGLSLAEEARADWLVQAAMAFAERPEGERDGGVLGLLTEQLKRFDPARLDRYARYDFPTFDRPNDLMLARSALRLGIEGEWLRPWVERIEGAQDEQGLWRLQQVHPLAGDVRWETEGEPSRWISAQALYVLRAFYGE
jgi:hypothetical protein